MYCSLKDKDLFYTVKPGDSLSRIALRRLGSEGIFDLQRELRRLIAQNPHISNPDRIYPGNLIFLGSLGTSGEPSWMAADLGEMQRVWNRTTQETKDVVRANFDILDWLSDRKDQAEFVMNSVNNTVDFWNSVQPYTSTVTRGEVLKISAIYEELVQVRQNTISIMRRYSLSVAQYPVFLIAIRPNGLYSHAQKLIRMVELAEKLKINKFMIWADVAIEAGKVARVAATTGSPRATSEQAFKSGGKVGGGALGGALAGRVCKTAIGLHKLYGGAVCVIAVGLGIWGGQSAGEMGGEFIFTEGEKYFFPPLP